MTKLNILHYFQCYIRGVDKILKRFGFESRTLPQGLCQCHWQGRDLTESGKALAEVAIETSGHCAMRENGYLDDGTYTAVKVIGLLARVARARARGKNGEGNLSLLDLISELEEKEEVRELRMDVTDGSIDTTNIIFDKIVKLVKGACACEEMDGWDLDVENLEGIRVRTGEGGFFMLRKSLHEPIISLQIEGTDAGSVREKVVSPILGLLNSNNILPSINAECLQEY